MTLPHDASAERAVIGSIVLHPGLLSDLVAIVAEDDLYVPAHRAIYRAACRLADRGEVVDVVSLERQLRDDDALNLAGGIAGVSEFSNLLVSSQHALHHARRVRDMAGVRRTVELALTLSEDGRGPEASQDPLAWIEQAAHRLAEAGHVQRDDTGTDVSELCSPYIEELRARKEGKRDGVMSGLADLDAICGGFQPGELIVIGARPGIGKSALACDMARNAAVLRGIPVKFFSLEMTCRELMDRLVSAHAKVRLTALRQGVITKLESDSIVRALTQIHKAPLSLDDRTALRLHTLSASARHWRRDAKRGGRSERALVIVDYLQLVLATRDYTVREREIAEVAVGLKNLAKDLACPVVALAQLHRDAEERRPTLKDFRESGAIEQAANVAIFIHRPGAREGSTKTPPGDTELVVAKNRNGPTSIANVQYDGFHTTFYSQERHHEQS